jgi:hypothetical protein
VPRLTIRNGATGGDGRMADFVAAHHPAAMEIDPRRRPPARSASTLRARGATALQAETRRQLRPSAAGGEGSRRRHGDREPPPGQRRVMAAAEHRLVRPARRRRREVRRFRRGRGEAGSARGGSARAGPRGERASPRHSARRGQPGAELVAVGRDGRTTHPGGGGRRLPRGPSRAALRRTVRPGRRGCGVATAVQPERRGPPLEAVGSARHHASGDSHAGPGRGARGEPSPRPHRLAQNDAAARRSRCAWW